MTFISRTEDALARRVGLGWPGTAAAQTALKALVEDGLDERAEGLLDEIRARFGLTESDRAVLQVAVAAETSVAAHLLLGLLSGDPGPGRPTVALALELAGIAPELTEATRHLGTRAPLLRHGLLGLAGTDVLLSRRLVLPERVAAHLGGDDIPPQLPASMLLDPVAVTVAGTHQVVEALQAGHSLVWVHSPQGAAGAPLAVAACQQLQVACLVADLTRRDPRVPAREAVESLLLEAGLAGQVLVVSGAEQVRPEWWWSASIPVCAVAELPWDPTWSGELPIQVSAPRLTVAQRGALWRPLLGDLADSREISGMPLTAEAIVSVGRHASATARLSGRDLVVDDIRDSARVLSRGRSMGAAAGSGARLEDLVLPDSALAEVTRLLDWARFRDEVVALGPVHGKGGKGIGICALFSGSPGTGKTLAAHVIADSLSMDLYQVDLSTVVDKYIGETEKNLERVFAEAEATNAVLFFDEADALFGSRSAVKDAKDRYANQEIAYLLQRMEKFDGITLLATNLRGNLDPAFARRLHFMVAFPDPDERTRRGLWAQHLSGLGALKPDPEDLPDLDWLAEKVELSGGDIRNMVLAAVYAAVAGGDSLGMRHLVDAVRREHLKLGRRPPAPYLIPGTNP